MEQRVLFDSRESQFPGLLMVSRDRPHRVRSVQKGFWANAGDDIRRVLDDLITGPRSFARLMETSRKFSLIFERKQREFRRAHSASEFANTLRNLQFSEARFDSRVKPLYRVFRLLPVCIDTLAEISSSPDSEDKVWATSLLESWAGDSNLTLSLVVFLPKLPGLARASRPVGSLCWASRPFRLVPWPEQSCTVINFRCGFPAKAPRPCQGLPATWQSFQGLQTFSGLCHTQNSTVQSLTFACGFPAKPPSKGLPTTWQSCQGRQGLQTFSGVYHSQDSTVQ